jgi:uncharacterized protein (DUF2336 family)
MKTAQLTCVHFLSQGVLSERRRQLVHLAFRILDRDGSGQVEMADIQGVYNAQSHPDVVMGKRSEQEVIGACLLWCVCTSVESPAHIDVVAGFTVSTLDTQ